jgi:hypothetical protein
MKLRNKETMQDIYIYINMDKRKKTSKRRKKPRKE